MQHLQSANAGDLLVAMESCGLRIVERKWVLRAVGIARTAAPKPVTSRWTKAAGRSLRTG